MGRFPAFAFQLSFALSSLAFSADLRQIEVRRQNVSAFLGTVPDELVVKFSEGTLADLSWASLDHGSTGIVNLDALGQKYKVSRIKQQFPGAAKKVFNGRELDLLGWFKVKFAASASVDSVIESYKDEAGVLDAQSIGVCAAFNNPNDSYFANQRHLDQANDADMDAAEAWDIETGDSTIIVAVLDTGVRYFHKDLGGINASYSHPENARGNMWINTPELNGTTGNDDEGNTFIDDWIGWDFVDDVTLSRPYFPISGEDYDVADNDPRDFNGHGTHCAGNVAAMNNNGYATASPSGGWGNGTLQAAGNGAKVMALRIGYSATVLILGEMGLVRMDFAAQALRYAADNGAKIASCSWGSNNSGGLADAIDYFLAGGGLIFKAAGNDDLDEADYMANRADVLSVTATDSNDTKADFSNFGTWVDLSAPGTGIWSSYHVHSDAQNDYIARLDGTSMATPLAAGVAALIWSHNPSWSANQVKQKLFDSADTIDTLPGNAGYVGKLGTGRANAFNAVTLKLAAKLFLEGPYDANNHQMGTLLNSGNYIPTTSPFGEDTRAVTSIATDIVDWVLVQLRSTTGGGAVASRSAFLRKDGRLVADDGTTNRINVDVSPGDYYLVLKHQNHLSVMSAGIIALSSSSTPFYDFTTGSDQYYGASAKLLESGIYGLYAGDTDASGTVDANDRSATWNNRNSNGYYSSDCDLSGTVDANDRSVTWNNRNLSTNVP